MTRANARIDSNLHFSGGNSQRRSIKWGIHAMAAERPNDRGGARAATARLGAPRRCCNIGQSSAWHPRASKLAAGTLNTYKRQLDSKPCRHVQDAPSHGVSSHGVSLRIRSTVIGSSGEAHWCRRGREHDVDAWRSHPRRLAASCQK